MIKEKLQSHKMLILGGIFAFILIGLFSLTIKAQWVISKVSVDGADDHYEIFKAFGEKNTAFTALKLPEKEPNRLDVLVLGMRGIGEEFGGLLTDTILLLSLDTTSGKVAMVSIPRDLYITLPYNGKIKINELYSIGYDKGGEKLALNLSKTVVSQITGVYVDNAVRIDFKGFEKIIDTVGGIDVYLSNGFTEIEQWKGSGGLSLPKGWNHLDGETALFYARSRFSTSDFDRARRQQEILLALKERVTALKILSNPVKVYGILDAIGDHVRTDSTMNISDVLALAQAIDYTDVKRLVLTTQNYLYQTIAPNGAYILLPKDGSFEEVGSVIKNIFTLQNFPNSAIPLQTYERTLNSHNSLSNASSTGDALEGLNHGAND